MPAASARRPSRFASSQSSGDPESCKLPACLYLVATPIGNLEDLSARAKRILSQCDHLLCEDTRVTRTLLQAWGIDRSGTGHTHSYREHNARSMEPRILTWLAEGLSVALVSDAGLPLISDPGAPLTTAVMDAGHQVSVIPGATAGLAALLMSGLPPERFFFAGFLPSKKSDRRQELSALASIPATLIFYESPNRVADMLADSAELLGPRQGAVVREITKLYEEVKRATLPELALHYSTQEARGEIVVVIAPPGADASDSAVDPVPLLQEALARGASIRDATAIVTARTGLNRREIYALAVQLSQQDRS